MESEIHIDHAHDDGDARKSVTIQNIFKKRQVSILDPARESVPTHKNLLNRPHQKSGIAGQQGYKHQVKVFTYCCHCEPGRDY